MSGLTWLAVCWPADVTMTSCWRYVSFSVNKINPENKKIFRNSSKLNRSSDENVFYMKVAQKNPTNPNVRSFHLSHAPSMLNKEPSPLFHLSGIHLTSANHPRMFSPSVCNVHHYVRSTVALHIVMSCLVMHLFALYLLFLPPLLSGRPQDRWCRCDRLHHRRPLLLVWATRQANPPWAFRYCLFLFLSCLH